MDRIELIACIGLGIVLGGAVLYVLGAAIQLALPDERLGRVNLPLAMAAAGFAGLTLFLMAGAARLL
jgi:hypothetical protein